MGKIHHIRKSRKERICGKCRKIIPVGSPYIKGTINFNPDIIRCTKCGLKSYEVTTSDFIRNVGAIVEDWETDFDSVSGVWDDLADNLEEIRDEQQERLDNMPEHLQYDSETGQLLMERIETLDSTIDDLRGISTEDLLSDAFDELSEEHQETIAIAGSGKDDYEEWYEKFFEEGTEAAVAWKEAFEEKLRETVNDFLSQISY